MFTFTTLFLFHQVGEIVCFPRARYLSCCHASMPGTVLVTAEASRLLMCELNKWVLPPGSEPPSPGAASCASSPHVTRLYGSALVVPSRRGHATSRPREAGSMHSPAVQDGDSSHLSSFLSLNSDPGVEMRSREAAPEPVLLLPH